MVKLLPGLGLLHESQARWQRRCCPFASLAPVPGVWLWGSCSSRGRTNSTLTPPTPLGAEPPTPLHGLGAPWLPPLGLGRVRATLLLPGVCCCEIWGGFFGGAEVPRSCSGVPRGPRRAHRLSLFPQQLYQTLSDFDIRFYMYEILKVSPQGTPPRAESHHQHPPGEPCLAPNPGGGTAPLGSPPLPPASPPGSRGRRVPAPSITVTGTGSGGPPPGPRAWRHRAAALGSVLRGAPPAPNPPR